MTDAVKVLVPTTRVVTQATARYKSPPIRLFKDGQGCSHFVTVSETTLLGYRHEEI